MARTSSLDVHILGNNVINYALLQDLSFNNEQCLLRWRHLSYVNMTCFIGWQQHLNTERDRDASRQYIFLNLLAQGQCC